MEDDKNFLIRNLKDSGFTDKQINEYMELKTTNEKNKFLENHRKNIMKEYHICQEQVDSIDYLIFTNKKNLLEKEKTNE